MYGIMRESDPEFDRLVMSIVGIVLALRLVFFIYRKFWPGRPKPVSPRPVTRWQLLRADLLPQLVGWFALMLPLNGILYAAWVFGGISSTTAAGCMILISLFICVFFFPVFFVLFRAFAPLHRIQDFDARLQGKQLEWQSGIWAYSDRNWYICAGQSTCAVLCADEIDFSVPVRCSDFTWKNLGFKGYYHSVRLYILHFARKDGGEQTAVLYLCPEIVQWIRTHNGTPAWIMTKHKKAASPRKTLR